MDCTKTTSVQTDAWRRCYDCGVDLETVEAIDRLTERFESFESSIRTELRTGLADVRAEVADVRTGLAEVRYELAGVRHEFADVRSEIADVRRHAVILNEATRDDIRLVAEAVAALAVKVDSLQR